VPIQVGAKNTCIRVASAEEAVAAKRKLCLVASAVKGGGWVPAVRMPSQAAVLVGVTCKQFQVVWEVTAAEAQSPAVRVSRTRFPVVWVVVAAGMAELAAATATAEAAEAVSVVTGAVMLQRRLHTSTDP
jgi:hypothetical protein